MANAYKKADGSKVYNRNIEISKPSALVHDGAYVTQTVQKTFVANGECIDCNIFVANRRWKVVGVSEVHTTAGSDGGTVSIDVKKCTGTTVPASGTSVLSAAFNAKGTAQTVQSGTLSATDSVLVLEPGERLGVDFSGTLTALAGVCVAVDMIPA